MIKKLLVLFCFVIFVLLTSCSKKNESIILFNHYPISEKNVLDNSTLFKTEERIYFIYMTKKNLNTEFIRIKIFKRSANANDGYGETVYSNDFKLKKGEINYFTDYLVMHKAGNYIMHVYRTDYLWKPDAIADFKVVER